MGVTANTPVTITATYSLGGVTKTQTVQVTVNAPTTTAPAPVAQVAAPEVVAEMSDDENDSVGFAEGRVPQKKKPKPPKPPNAALSVTPTNITEGHSTTVGVSINKANPIQDIDIHYSLSGSALVNNHFVLCGDPGRNHHSERRDIGDSAIDCHCQRPQSRHRVGHNLAIAKLGLQAPKEGGQGHDKYHERAAPSVPVIAD